MYSLWNLTSLNKVTFVKSIFLHKYKRKRKKNQLLERTHISTHVYYYSIEQIGRTTHSFCLNRYHITHWKIHCTLTFWTPRCFHHYSAIDTNIKLLYCMWNDRQYGLISNKLIYHRDHGIHSISTCSKQRSCSSIMTI